MKTDADIGPLPRNESDARRRWTVAVLLVICLAAFALRTIGVWGDVFGGDAVTLRGVDPWYHLRRIENLARQFPHAITHDPYALHPGGDMMVIAPLLDALVVAVTWVVTGGYPSDAALATVDALVPPLGAAVLLCVVYAVGKLLANRRTGLLAAAMLAVMPGRLLHSTMLGFADHHVLEALLSSLVLLVIARSLRALDAEGLRNRLLRACAYGAGMGLVLGAYLLAWTGGFVLVGLLVIAVLIHAPWRHLRGGAAAPGALAFCTMAFVAGAMVWPLRNDASWFTYQLIGLLILVLASGVLCAISIVLHRLNVSRLGSVLVFVAVAAAGAVIICLVRPDWASRVRGLFAYFVVGEQRTLVEEASPILFREGTFTLSVLWKSFAVTVYVALAGAVVLGVQTVRRYAPERVVFLVWSVVMLVATMQQRRFAYYSAVNVALLAAFVCDLVLVKCALADGARGFQSGRRTAVAWAVIAFGVIAPGLPGALAVAREPSGPSPDWRAALTWVRENTPEPFGDAGYYYARYADDGAANRRSTYGVVTAWDRGYWLVEIARRVPCGNPTQSGAQITAAYFMAESEAEAGEIMERAGGRYVMLDYSVPIWRDEARGLAVGKFRTLALWAGLDPSRYFELCRAPRSDRSYQPVMVYHPAYFRTMAARLFTFAGRGSEPVGPVMAIVLHDPSDGGEPILAATRKFDAYADAQAFVDANAEKGWRIASFSPFETPIPLERLARHTRVYGSPTVLGQRAGQDIHAVEVYEYAAVGAE